jgi:hypothetical protein
MNPYGPKQLGDSMRTVRKNTILIAEDIPEKDYGYRPTPDSRSVAETLVHIASVLDFDRFVHEEFSTPRENLSSFMPMTYPIRGNSMPRSCSTYGGSGSGPKSQSKAWESSIAMMQRWTLGADVRRFPGPRANQFCF